ncbi:transcriptional regulator swi6 [Malassezia brasiliensis]|uniref:Transcriptional regulator swi6 n=1 Tax=Malassezia brasiliensis TaxID=1821822 RepID=A0AAF0IRE4_9BASI|nr:transcriptional regulator swi6 [Malassezia brasiliensis]
MLPRPGSPGASAPPPSRDVYAPLPPRPPQAVPPLPLSAARRPPPRPTDAPGAYAYYPVDPRGAHAPPMGTHGVAGAPAAPVAPPPAAPAHAAPAAPAPLHAPTPPPAAADAVPSGPTPTVYLANYSSVPVYEITVRGIALMRRRSDGYLNATQILKIAGIEKARRTRILEREILTGEHDKVQGGYGTFQGTWIPLQRAQELAMNYSVYHLIRPLLDFDPAATRATAAPYRAAARRRPRAAAGRGRRRPAARAAARAAARLAAARRRAPRDALAQKRARHTSPIRDLNVLTNTPLGAAAPPGAPPGAARGAGAPRFADKAHAPHLGDERERRTREVLTALFVDDARTDDAPADAAARLTALLAELGVRVPSGGEAAPSAPGAASPLDVVIDDHGHTALHWASALCRLRLVRMLTALPPPYGANLYLGNYAGETALHRSVLVTNAYEQSQFAELLELLADSLQTRDARKRTVLHHIALVAGLQGRAAPAKYYLQCVLAKLGPHDADLLDARDDEGETALGIVARLGNTHMIKMLLDAGARKDLPNALGITPLDWGITGLPESPASRPVAHELASLRPADVVKSLTRPPAGPVQKSDDVRHKLTQTLDELHTLFAHEAEGKQQALATAQAQLQSTTRELAARRRLIADAQRDVARHEDARQRLANVRRALDATGTAADAPPADAPLAEAAARLDAPDTPDAALTDALVRVRWLTSELRAQADALTRTIDATHRAGDAQRAAYHRVVAMCARVPPDKVDGMLDELLAAVESMGAEATDLVAVSGFLHKVGRPAPKPEPAPNAHASPPAPAPPASAPATPAPPAPAPAPPSPTPAATPAPAPAPAPAPEVPR